MNLLPPDRPRGYFHEDEEIDRLYRIIEHHEYSLNVHTLLLASGTTMAVLAVVI